MNRIIYFLLGIMLFLYPLKGNAQNESSSEINKIIKEHLEEFPTETQFSIALIDNEKTSYIGFKKTNEGIKLITNEKSVFEIGSITKVFTSILLSNFVEKHELDLDNTIEKILPYPIAYGGTITLKQLANHTSGLPRIPDNMLVVNPLDPYVTYTTNDLDIYLEKGIKLNSPIGTVCSYSNLGMGTLGYILTKKSGKTYENLIQELVFKPLEMNQSTTLLENVPVANLVTGLDHEGNETSNWNFTDAVVGAGGIKSSVLDLEKFVRKNFTDDKVYLTPQQATYTLSPNMKVGLGWHIISKDKNDILWHNGGTGGYTSSLSIDKKNKRSVIVLTNVSAMHKNRGDIDKLCFNLLKML